MRRVPAQVMFGVLLVLLPMLDGFILLALRSALAALAFLVLLLSRRFLLGLLACFLVLILGLILFHDSTPWIYWVIPVVSPYITAKYPQDLGGLSFKLSSELIIY